MMKRQAFLRAGAAAIAGTAMGGAWSLLPTPAHAAASPLPNTPVIDQFGRQLRFYDDLVRGRALMINFFYAGCGDTCPLVTQNLREVQDLLGDRMGRDIFMVSVTLQPALETPAILRDYAANWEIRPGWSFLTGEPDDIELLRRTLGFEDVSPEFASVLDSHTGLVRYGNDRLQRWAGTTGLGRPEWIAKTVARIADMG